MANKKVSQLVSKPSVLVTDLFPIADPTTGQLFKTTISDLGTAIGSGVSSVNGLVGAVVLDTDDIQELASPTNRWFTDTRARAAISAGTGISYNSGTGVITNAVTSGQIATALGYTPANDSLVVKLAGTETITGLKTFSGGLIANVTSGGAQGFASTNTSSSATSVFVQNNSTGIGILANNALGGDAILIGNDTSGRGIYITNATISGGGKGISIDNYNSGIGIEVGSDSSADAIKVLHLAGRAFNIQSSGGGYGVIINNTNASTSAPFTIQKQGASVITLTDAGAGTFNSSLTASSFVRTSGTSSQFLKADGSVDSNTYLTTGSAASSYLPLSGGTLTGALSGTSATFSGLTIDNNQNGSTWIISKNQNSGAGAAAGFLMTNNTGDLGAISLLSSGNSPANALFIRTLSTNSLILGTNSTANLTIASGGAATFSSSITINSNSSDGGFAQIFGNNSYINLGADKGGGAILRYNSNGNLDITPRSGFSTIFTSGNVGIGTTSPLGILHTLVGSTLNNYFYQEVTTTNVWAGNLIRYNSTDYMGSIGNVSTGEYKIGGFNNTGYFVTLYTNNTERMRITSGGYTKMTTDGTYWNASGYHEMRQTVTNNLITLFTNSSASPYGLNIYFTAASPNNTTNYFLTGGDNTNDKFFIYSNGSMVNRTGSYGTISDIKFKENIVDATPKLGDIAKLKVRNFNLIGESTKQIGFIAQEFEEVFPNMIDVSTETGTDGETYKSIKTSVLVPMLVKAIQELNDKVKTLENK